MYKRDYRDIIAGGVLVGLGLFAAIYASQNYAVGTPRHMGPGWFPTALGILLTGLGAIIALPAFFRRGGFSERFDLRQFLVVCAAVLVFALTIRPLGLVPAIVLLAIVATQAAPEKFSVKLTVILASVMSLGAVLIFIYGLGMPMQIINWRFY